MNTIGMASVTAFYNLHTSDRRQRAIPYHLNPRSTRVSPESMCGLRCTPNTCPILFRFLTYNDTREVTTNPTPVQHVDGYGDPLDDGYSDSFDNRL